MNQQQITTRQAFLIMISVLSTSVLQPSFRNFLRWAGNGGWLPLTLAIVFGVAYVWLLLSLAKRFPKQSVAEYSSRVLGPIVGYPLVVLLVATFFLRGAFALRNMSEFFVAAILPETPISAVLIVMIVLVTYAIWSELEGIVRFNELATPLIIGSFILVFIGTMRLSIWNLLPVLNKGMHGLLPVFQSASSDLAIVSYILFIYPYLVDPQNAARVGSRHIVNAGLLLLFIYMNTVLSLGSHIGAALTWPYLVVTENIWLVERGEALFMVIWTLAAFIKTSFCLYTAALGISQLIPKVSLKWVGIVLIPLASYLALIPDDLPSAVAAYVLFNKYTLFIELAIPMVILLFAILRRMGGNSREQTSN
ncbi:MAG TPA: hypothetical protein DDZ53_10045 [Firmicutes bacterium]|nr:hypothetical protein [Bacillota bacterium]